MSGSSHQDLNDTRLWRPPRGHGHQGRYPGLPPPEMENSDVIEYVPAPLLEYQEHADENSPHWTPELGIRDISDPGLEGSHHGGWRSTSSSELLLRYYRDDISYEEPNRSGYNDGLSPPPVQPLRSPSRSSSVTSHQRYSELEAPPEDPEHGDRSRSRYPNLEGTGPRRTRSEARNTEGNVLSVIRQLAERMGNRRTSRRQQDSPPSPPDFLKMIMMMQNLGTRKFFGDTGPLEADAWMKHLEKNFEATRCPEGYKTDIAVHYLMKDASNWWDGVKNQYMGTEISWDIFRREFERKYFPPEARDRLEAQFQNLIQGQRNVREYEAEFTRLRRYAHYGPGDEPIVIRKFLRGLRPEIMSRLVVNQYYSLFELVERAVDVEEGIRVERDSITRAELQFQEQQLRVPHQQQQSGLRNQVARPGNWAQGRGRGQGQGQTFGRGRGPGQGQTYSRGRGRGIVGRGTPMMQQPTECFNCGGRGHYARTCPNVGQTARSVPTRVVCYTCNQPGHYSTSCPVTHPTGQSSQPAGVRAMQWEPEIESPYESEPPAKRQAIMGRVYSLDKPEPSRPSKGPLSGN